MPRNGSGTYTLPSAAFVGGTTISSSAVNADMSDIALALTASIAADGQTPITGGFKFPDGTAGAPAWTFVSEPTTGLYKVAPSVLGVSAGGTRVFSVQPPQANVGAGLLGLSGAILLPIGLVLDIAGSSVPTGWFLCYGQALNRTTYSELFGVIGTIWGSGDGSTTFNLPDLRGRATFGVDNMGGSAANRLPGGSLASTGGQRDVTISQANLPSATLTTSITDPGHTHSLAIAQQEQNIAPGGGLTAWTPVAGGTQQSIVSANTGITASTQLGGSGTALTVLNPAACTNKIIFAGHP